MYHLNQIIRFQEGTLSPHQTPEASVTATPAGLDHLAGKQLMVLVDLMPSLPHRSREIRAVAMQTYWASSGSVVARLRRALAEANRHLAHVNLTAAPGSKCTGSITCAVCLEEEIFFGQIGAAYAFVQHPQNDPQAGKLEVFPQRDRILMPLGVLPPVIHIGYTTMEPESVACLATTPIAEAQARERWHDVLRESEPEALEEQVTSVMAQSGASGSLLLAHWMQGEAPPTAPLTPSPARGWRLFRPQPAPTPAVVPVPEADIPVEPEAATVSVPLAEPMVVEEPVGSDAPEPADVEDVGQLSVAQDTDVVADTTVRVEAPLDEAAEPLIEDDAERAPGLRLPPIPEKWRAYFSPEVKAQRAQVREQRKYIREQRKAIRAQYKQERTTTVEKARLRQALKALLPGKVESPQSQPRPAPPEKISVMGGLTLGLLLIVFFITVTEYWQDGGAGRAAAMLETALSVRQVAYDSQEPEDWDRLLKLTTKITTLDPQNTEANALMEEAQHAIDALVHAAVLAAQPLRELGTAPAPRRMLVAEGWIYILNTATDEVIGVQLAEDYVTPLSDAPIPILRAGQTFFGETVDHLVDMAWIVPGGNYPDGAVFIYSDDGLIYIYEPVLGPGSITKQRVQGNLKAGVVTHIETFGDKVYLVQRQDNQILTYEPVNGIYNLPRDYFPPNSAPDLQKALDIGIDGRVYLLMGDGNIHTYFAGSEDPTFQIKNLPDGDLKPIVLAMEPDPENGLLYLGDSQRERIVVLNKRGDFMHQFRLPGEELQQLEALAVSESPPVLYMIAANRLYAAPIPEFVTQ